MRKNKLIAVTLVALAAQWSALSNFSIAQDDAVAESTPKRTVEPVFRVSKLNEANNDSAPKATPELPAAKTPEPEPTIVASNTNPGSKITPGAKAAPHPLDSAITLAHDSLAHMRANIKDYEAVLVKRERINEKLGDRSYIKIKIRNERTTPTGTQPFSIYMSFLKPKAQAGREVIWVQGKNQNKLSAHEGGMLGRLKMFNLDPDGWLAMQGNKYPVYDAGLENLILKLIEKAERDKGAGMCEVSYNKKAKINNRPCSMIQVVHEQPQHPYEFYKAQVFIDDELKIPVRYVAYDWPVNGKSQVIEEYTYINIRTNVGLTDRDFDTSNPSYNFPR